MYNHYTNVQTMHRNCVTNLLDALVSFSSDIRVHSPAKRQRETVKWITKLQALALFQHIHIWLAVCLVQWLFHRV